MGLRTYSLRCTVCQGEFSSKSEWHTHLILEQHQRKARVECVGKWATQSDMNRCCLVIYTSFPMTREDGAKQVMQHFSRDPGTFVTDFVCWDERPFLGLLQFESRVKVDKVLAAANGADTTVAGRRIHVKRASELHELEWKAIFQQDASVEENGESKAKPSDQERGSIKRERECAKSGLKPPEETTASPKRPKLIEVGSSKPVSKSGIQWRSPELPSLLFTSLAHQFWQVRKAVTIPGQELDQVVGIRDALLDHWKKVDKDIKVFIGNWHLKLGSLENDQDEPFIYAYQLKFGTNQRNPIWLSDSEVRQVFNLPQVQRNFGVVVEFHKGQGKYVHKNTERIFRLATSPKYFVEQKMCQLTKYLCLYDSRCYPLLTLTFFWCQLNGLAFADPENKNNEPFILEWLVMFWLSHKKFIPTVREIQARHHRVVQEPEFGIDVGFTGAFEWAKEWRTARKQENPSLPLEEDYTSEEFLMNVLHLFQEFLQFYGDLRHKCSILYTRDGKIVSTQVSQLHMAHPFISVYAFPISNNIKAQLEAMRRSAEKLDKFIQMGKDKGQEETLGQFGGLKELLRVP